MVGDSAGSSKAFHEYVIANGMDEFSDTHRLCFTPMDPGWIHSNKNVATLDDVAGQSCAGQRGSQDNCSTSWGATPVGMPVSCGARSGVQRSDRRRNYPWEVTLPLKMSELSKTPLGVHLKAGPVYRDFCDDDEQGQLCGVAG